MYCGKMYLDTPLMLTLPSSASIHLLSEHHETNNRLSLSRRTLVVSSHRLSQRVGISSIHLTEMACCTKCHTAEWNQPILRPLATTSHPGATFLQPSGPASNLAVPYTTGVTASIDLWDGTTWTPSGLVLPIGGSYTWWNTLVGNVLTVNYGTAAGVLPDAFAVGSLLSITSDSSGRFFVAGTVAGVPTLAMYNNTLTNLASVVLPGVPSLITYDGVFNVAVVGSDGVGGYYLNLYGMVGSSLLLIKSYTYGVPITSITLYQVDAVAGVSRLHRVLLVTTERYYLPGEVVTYPGTSVTLESAPPGDIFIYDVPLAVQPVYAIPAPLLLWSERYGGLLSAAYSRRKGALFALNETSTVVSWSVVWVNDSLMLQQAPTSIAAPGATGVYIVEGPSRTNLIVYGVGLAVAYEVLSLPLTW